jgi:Holliday junction DNA helicase RuvA
VIGSLQGHLVAKQGPAVVIECGGVGYEVETPMSTFFKLPAIGSPLFLHTHLQVRDDAHTLYGFSTGEEKRLFRQLLRVNGVGAKLALAILSGMGVAEFEHAVRHEDAAMLVRIPGVGKKTAERLIIEMRDKIEQSPAGPTLAKAGHLRTDARSEAVDALVALGYKPAEVHKLLAKLEVEDKSAEDIIRLALRQAVA